MPTGAGEPPSSFRAPSRVARRGGADAALAARPPRAAFIERSHERSAALGLSRGEKSEFGPLILSDLNIARERNRRLHLHAAPIMHMLFEQIVDTQSMIVLTDVQGTILHAVGDDDFLRRADKVALSPGENWAEYSKGTNAIGTALFEEVPTLVHAQEHFIHANSFLTCSAAPIFDPRGNVLGILDVTGDHRSYHQHTMGLVRMSARMIENHWLSDDCNSQLRVHFHLRPEFVGSLLEGIVVLGPDGRVLGANRGAIDLIGMSAPDVRAHSVSSLFGCSTAAVFDHFRAPSTAPMLLRLPCGRAVHAVARFDGPHRSLGMATDVLRHDRADAPSVTLAARLDTIAPSATVPPGGTGLTVVDTGDSQIGALVQKVRRVLDKQIALLITGETGTGKSLLARAVHDESTRASKPFVSVDCAGVPASALEVELFGCVRSARAKSVPGRVVQAQGGTLFLDEVDALPPGLQARLLQVLQERSLTPVGADARSNAPLDIAVISATRCDLREHVTAHGFRQSLYYRLNGLTLRMPPLRERTDLDALAMRILRAERPNDPPRLADGVLQLLRHHAWPGNIRQLANVLRAAALMAAGEPEITVTHLADDFLEEASRAASASHPLSLPSRATGGSPGASSHAYAAARGDVALPSVEPPHTLEQAEVAMIRAALDAAHGNISAASKQLGISRNTIYRKLRWNVPDSSR